MVLAVATLLAGGPPFAYAEEIRLTGGAVLDVEGFESPPLDAAGKARIRQLRKVALAPSSLLSDPDVLTEVVRLIREPTGWEVATPRDFSRATAEIGETPLETGLTQDEQNSVARKVGARLGAGGVFVTHVQDRGSTQRVDILGQQRIDQAYTLRARLVGVATTDILWSQAMNYKVIVRYTIVNVFRPPTPPPAAEVTLIVARKMVDRFLSDAWTP